MKSLIAIALIFSTLQLYAQKEYTIEGKLTGIEDSTEISLFQDDGNVFSNIATDTIFGGKFKFRGKTEGLTHLVILSNAPGFPSKWLDVWVSPAVRIRITGNDKLLRTWLVESPIKEQIETNRYTKATKSDMDKLQQLSVIRNTLTSRILEKGSTDQRKKIKASIDSVDQKQDSITAIIHRAEIRLLETSPVTSIWIDKLKTIAMDVKYNKKSVLREPTLALFNRLDKKQKESAVGQEIYTSLFPPKVVKKGEPMADKALKDLEGKQHFLADYKGKHLLLDFWSLGCGPCIMAMPELRKLSSSYTDSLTVVSLSVDVKKELWRKATESQKVTWVNLSDGLGMSGIAAQYGVRGIPHYVLISPEGKIISSWTGFSEGDLEKRIKKLIFKDQQPATQ
ncbi:MAG: AhpC/TSA family protein [Sphingobacteriaceae bacterium]|nr:AhpC/TSA family protein [Sphingobacteriaceae bacterium]